MRKLFNSFLVFGLLLALSGNGYAWDVVGHKLTSSIALQYLSDKTKTKLLAILKQHPRFQQDFIEPMPGFIEDGDESQRLDWLLGQAAYWPDRARSLPAGEREKFNRPSWHYIDGAWLRDNAQTQGNIYAGIEKFAAIDGEAASSIRNEAQVNNVMTALDFNTGVLANEATAASSRAVALCWVLHLIADIHQPLHAGSLYSAELFATGDRGGNRISTDDGNLHARWDRALTSEGLEFHRRAILGAISQNAVILGVDSDWSQWLDESRQLLLSLVYTTAMQREIASAEEENRNMANTPLNPAYVAQMKNSARQRIELAGLRLAIWFENELN